MNHEPFPSILQSAENERRIERNRAAARELHRQGAAHMARFNDGEQVGHEFAWMKLVGRDYITQRLNGKRCHHKLIYACPTCEAEKRYFLNLMPKSKFPRCNGMAQKLEVKP